MDAKGMVTEYVYNSLMQIEKVRTGAKGAKSGGVYTLTGEVRETAYDYDDLGRNTKVTNEHIEKVLQQGYIKAYGPKTFIDALIDHKNPAVWVSEGKQTLFNRIFSGMVGKRGESSITFEISSELIKKPSGIKKIFGKTQRVIKQDVEIPYNVIVRKAGE